MKGKEEFYASSQRKALSPSLSFLWGHRGKARDLLTVRSEDDRRSVRERERERERQRDRERRTRRKMELGGTGRGPSGSSKGDPGEAEVETTT